MPRITELPEHGPMTGAELVAIVQDGETRQVSVTLLLDSPRPAAAVNARWLRHSAAPTDFINSMAFDIYLPQNNQGSMPS